MVDATCSIDDCDRRRYGHGLCRRHWRFWRLYGDPLLSRHIPNVHRVVDDATHSVIVTKGNGAQFAVLVDTADASLVREYTWYIAPQGYAVSTTGSTSTVRVHTVMHRLVLGINGEPAELVVDHINGERLDNRRANLRATTSMVNGSNRAVENAVGTSRFRGVSWDKARRQWAAHVGFGYRLHHLGRFATEDGAAAAVARFRAENGLPSGY